MQSLLKDLYGDFKEIDVGVDVAKFQVALN